MPKLYFPHRFRCLTKKNLIVSDVVGFLFKEIAVPPVPPIWSDHPIVSSHRSRFPKKRPWLPVSTDRTTWLTV